MKILGHNMNCTATGWAVSIGGIRGSIRKEQDGTYSTEYLEKFVADKFELDTDARTHLEGKFTATLRALFGPGEKAQ